MLEWSNKSLVTNEILKEYFGFVYIITNKRNGKYYIGQKKFWNKKALPPLKGKKNRRHKLIESDWKTYTGSSKELNEDIEKLGEDNFEKKIIRLCESKWEMNYYEMKEQMDRNVLFDPLSYNGIINVRLKKLKKYR